MKGHLAAGVLDQNSKAWPDFHAMVDTCKKMNDHKNLCIEKFTPLYHHINEHGHVPDEVFESHGFPVDLDEHDKPVRRPAGISQEHLQRAKNLSHEHQKVLRRERTDEITRTQQDKLVEEKLKVLRMLESNRQCETTLMELVGGPQPRAPAQADLAHFNNKNVRFY
jgi:hypothetical protein